MKSPKVNDGLLRQLYNAFLVMETEEECHSFFFDLCTIGEVHSLAQRLEVARMVQAGFTYQQIEAATGASTATISRVKRFLYYGAGGYETVLSRMERSQVEDKDSRG